MRNGLYVLGVLKTAYWNDAAPACSFEMAAAESWKFLNECSPCEVAGCAFPELQSTRARHSHTSAEVVRSINLNDDIYPTVISKFYGDPRRNSAKPELQIRVLMHYKTLNGFIQAAIIVCDLLAVSKSDRLAPSLNIPPTYSRPTHTIKLITPVAQLRVVKSKIPSAFAFYNSFVI